MFLYYEHQPRSGPRRFCRVAWSQQVREGLQQWRLSVQRGRVGASTQSKENWYQSTDALHLQINRLDRSFAEQGFSRRQHPSLEQLRLPFHEDEHASQIELFNSFQA